MSSPSPRVSVRDVTHRYGRRVALADATLDLPVGVTGLLGPNGAGKSTLMKLLATAMPLQTGSVAVGDVPLVRDNLTAVRRQLGYLPQRFEVMGWSTVRRNVEYAAWAHGLLVAPLLVVAVTVLPTYLIDVVLLANSDASVAAVSYVWHLYHPLRGEMLVWQVEAFRVLFFLLVGVAALRAAAALAEWRAASNFHDGRGARHVAGVSGSEAIDPDLDASGRTLRVSRTLTGEV